VAWECKNSDPIKYSKRAVFTALFFVYMKNWLDDMWIVEFSYLKRMVLLIKNYQIYFYLN